MNKAIKLLLLFAPLFAAFSAQADAVVVERTFQKGTFSPPKCDGAEGCLCESDIKYPAIVGMKDAKKQDALNAAMEKSAEQMKCQGTPVTAKGTGDNFSVSHSYEVTFSSPDILGFKFTDWAYEGGAHGNGSVEGMIIDLESGSILSANDIFGAKNLAAVNKIIYDTLAPKSEGVFRDEIEGRKGNFIKDNQCQGCTLVMTRDGVQVVFEAYEVAPFADGNPSIAIPAQYIAYPAITKAIAKNNSGGAAATTSDQVGAQPARRQEAKPLSAIKN